MLNAVALLLATIAASRPVCHSPAAAQPAGTVMAVRHVFQNGGAVPLRLAWIDAGGAPVDLGTIAPGAFRSLQTYVGHRFVLTDPAGRCRKAVRIDDVFSGTFVGTSRYRSVAVRPGWHVMVDKALNPRADPARAALATVARMLADADAVLPPAALARMRKVPIFLHNHAGPSAMFHSDPEWLAAHGRTVELVNAIEISDAGVFVETSRVQPGSVLHELSHAYYYQLSDADRASIEAAYRRALEERRYLGVRRHDGSVTDAYARTNPAEYFAELTEAYFSRNDFFPFTRADLASYDPAGERLIARLWR